MICVEEELLPFGFMISTEWLCSQGCESDPSELSLQDCWIFSVILWDKVMLNWLLLYVMFSNNWPFLSPSCLKPVNFELVFMKAPQLCCVSCPVISLIAVVFFHVEDLFLLRLSTKKWWLIWSWGAHMVTPLLWIKINFPSHRSWFYHSSVSLNPLHFQGTPLPGRDYSFSPLVSRRGFIHTPCSCLSPCIEDFFQCHGFLNPWSEQLSHPTQGVPILQSIHDTFPEKPPC